MTLSLPSIVAAVGQPLFGNQWLALLAILAGVAVLILVVAGVGRWLAATHPDTPVPSDLADEVDPPPNPHVMAVIAAAVAYTYGKRARITAVQLPHPHAPTVEALMIQWSLEGRREIYSSHKVR
jgi:hypothetical protein